MGWPLRSYIARKKKGNMTSTMSRAAVLEEQRYADERAADEADKLPLGQIESDLGFDFRQVLGDRNIGHLQHILYL